MAGTFASRSSDDAELKTGAGTQTRVFLREFRRLERVEVAGEETDRPGAKRETVRVGGLIVAVEDANDGAWGEKAVDGVCDAAMEGDLSVKPLEGVKPVEELGDDAALRIGPDWRVTAGVTGKGRSMKGVGLGGGGTTFPVMMEVTCLGRDFGKVESCFGEIDIVESCISGKVEDGVDLA